jgi:hypothetical protein
MFWHLWQSNFSFCNWASVLRLSVTMNIQTEGSYFCWKSRHEKVSAAVHCGCCTCKLYLRFLLSRSFWCQANYIIRFCM